MKEKMKSFGWTVVIIGVVLLVLGIEGLIDNSKKPVAFEDLKLSDLKAGMIVDGNVSFNLGCFEESYKTRYGIKTGGSQYYYAVMVESKIIAIKCLSGGTVSNALEKQSNELLNYTGKDTPSFEGVAIKGKLKKMDSKTEGYLKDYLYYDELGGQILEISPYTIETVVMSMPSSIGLTAAGAACVIIPILIMLAGLKAASRSSYSNNYGSTDTYGGSYDSNTSGSYDSTGSTGGTGDTGYTSFGQDFDEYERSMEERDKY